MDDYYKHCPKGIELQKEIEKTASVTDVTLDFLKENIGSLKTSMKESFKQLNEKIDTSNKKLKDELTDKIDTSNRRLKEELHTRIDGLEKKVDRNNAELNKNIETTNTKLKEVVDSRSKAVGDEVEKKIKFGAFGFGKWLLTIATTAAITLLVKALLTF